MTTWDIGKWCHILRRGRWDVFICVCGSLIKSMHCENVEAGRGCCTLRRSGPSPGSQNSLSIFWQARLWRNPHHGWRGKRNWQPADYRKWSLLPSELPLKSRLGSASKVDLCAIQVIYRVRKRIEKSNSANCSPIVSFLACLCASSRSRFQ